MEEFHHYFHQSREIFDNGGNDRITSSDENLIQIFIKDENKSEYFHQIVPISTDSSGFIDRKKIVWIQRRSSFPPPFHQKHKSRLKITYLKDRK